MSGLYDTNPHNQLLSDDTYTYAYDARGNRISRTDRATGAVETYSYDSQNRLIGWTEGVSAISYAHDALDRRIAVTLDGVTESFVHDPWGPYDPLTGRFLQRDPIGFASGDLNLYAYVENDPYNWTDPSGEISGQYGNLARQSAQMARSAVGNIGRGVLGVANRIGNVLRSSTQIARSALQRAPNLARQVTRRDIEGHHPIPMALGGARNQPLYQLTRELHRGARTGFHSQLNRALRQEFGRGLAVGAVQAAIGEPSLETTPVHKRVHCRFCRGRRGSLTGRTLR
nr:RHS repeat-associated core domain-containing protein [Boseongicola sp. H5]